MSSYMAPIASDGEPCYWCDPANGPCRTHAAPPLYDPARIRDLEALREVTEQLVVALDPYMRHQWAAKAEAILKRLREPERVAS